MANVDRKFRLLADVVQIIESGKSDHEEIYEAFSSMGFKKTQIESIVLLAKKFGFINEDQDHKLHTTSEGLAFERYITAFNSIAMESESTIPPIDRGTALKVCLTVPPMWMQKVHDQFGDVVEQTLMGQKLVAEGTKDSLIIVTPFLDVGIMQVALRDVYAKNAELIVITSEPNLVKQFAGGNNFWLQKIEGLIRSRFKSGSVFYLSHNSSIAHAKVWCSDESLLVTSANVKPDSTTDNLEIGVFTDDPEIVSIMKGLLFQIQGLEGIKCLLRIPP